MGRRGGGSCGGALKAGFFFFQCLGFNCSVWVLTVITELNPGLQRLSGAKKSVVFVFPMCYVRTRCVSFRVRNEAREKGDALLHCCNFARIRRSVSYKRHFQCYPQTKSVKFKFQSLAEYSTAESGFEATLRYLKH